MKKKAAILLFVCLNLVLCASSQKKLERAREKDPQYQYNMGLFYMNNNNVDEAIKYLNKSLALNPRYHLALNALGLAYSMKGKLQDSIALYQKCLEVNPGFSEARNNLGAVYQELGFADKAEQEFRKVLDDLNYNFRELPYYNLARLAFVQKDYEKALGLVQKAIEVNSRFAMGHNLKGLILENMNRLPDAIASYSQAIKIVPDDVNFDFNLAVAYFKNNDFRLAGEIFEKISPRVSDPEMKDKLAHYLKTIKEQQKEL